MRSQVHPDLFGAFPYERTKNSDALKVRAGAGSTTREGA